MQRNTHTTHTNTQVMLVGDLNIAAEKRDVHHSMKYEDIYDDKELQVRDAVERERERQSCFD